MEFIEKLTTEALNNGAETLDQVVGYCTMTVLSDFPNCSHTFPHQFSQEELTVMENMFSEWCEDQRFKYG